MLRKVGVGAAVLVMLLVAGIALAATLEGTIKSIDAAKNSLTVTGKDGKDVAVTVEKDAKITLDGKAAKLSDLKAGQSVTVTHEGGKASAVAAKSAKGGK